MLKAAGSIFIVAGTHCVSIIVADIETNGFRERRPGQSI